MVLQQEAEAQALTATAVRLVPHWGLAAAVGVVVEQMQTQPRHRQPQALVVSEALAVAHLEAVEQHATQR